VVEGKRVAEAWLEESMLMGLRIEQASWEALNIM
jgi:hypothetical protein